MQILNNSDKRLIDSAIESIISSYIEDNIFDVLKKWIYNPNQKLISIKKDFLIDAHGNNIKFSMKIDNQVYYKHIEIHTNKFDYKDTEKAIHYYIKNEMNLNDVKDKIKDILVDKFKNFVDDTESTIDTYYDAGGAMTIP